MCRQSVRPWGVALAGLMFAALGAAPAWGDCPNAYEEVTYYKPAKLPKKDTRCQYGANGKCVKIELKGYLYRPDKVDRDVGAPLIIYAHGSGPNPGKECTLGKTFAALGYIVFVPIRRGVGISTGVAPDDYNQKYCTKKSDPGFCKMEYLHLQVEDTKEAIQFAKTLRHSGMTRPLVDSSRIALIGHSFGGISVAFANQVDLGQKAVIDLAGASQSWEDNATARSEMEKAVKEAVAPIYFLEPMNDRSIEPTLHLAKVSGKNCHQFQAALFPALDTNADGKITIKDYKGDTDGDGKDYDPRDVAHVGFTQGQIGAWSPSAHEFMTRYFAHPAAPADGLCIGTSTQGQLDD
jgi:dienelactone hydrolase